MNCPFSTWILCVLDANFGSEWSDLQHKKCGLDINDLQASVSNSIWHSVPSNSFPTVYPYADIGNVSSALILLTLVMSILPKYVVL